MHAARDAGTESIGYATDQGISERLSDAGVGCVISLVQFRGDHLASQGSQPCAVRQDVVGELAGFRIRAPEGWPLLQTNSDKPGPERITRNYAVDRG